MTHQHTNTTNHAVRRISRSTARIAIETRSCIAPERKPEIWRFFLDTSGIPQMHRGGILGKEPGKTCALLVNVSSGDLICVREKLAADEDHHWRYFRIGSSYQPIPVELPNRCLSKSEIKPLLQNVDSRETFEMEFSDEDLQRLFSQKHPDWLQQIARRQLAHWQKYKPAKFLLFAPAEISGSNISRCVRIAPYAALSRFQNRLTTKQLAQCLRSSPIGAVKHATTKIPSNKRRSYFSEFAHEALLYSADKLSDTEFEFCVSMEMGTAFRIRRKMSSERRALVLAHSYLAAGAGYSGDSLLRLHDEIRDSIVEHPGKWRASDPQGFPSIFQGLIEYLNMRIDPISILILLRVTEPKDQEAIAHFVISGI